MKIYWSLIRSQFTLPKIIFILLCLCYLIAASLQSLAQHYQFLTSTWDLGFHNQLMYKFAHFKSPGTTLGNTPPYPLNCFLGDHATFLMPLNSQLYWIFGSYGMLIAQILYGLVGALGIYKLIEYKCESPYLAVAGVFLFFTHYALYAALDFDAHDIVYGMMFLPWILYFYYKDNFKAFLVSLGIFLLAREDLSLTAIMLGLSFLIFDWREKLKYGIACLVITSSYFLIIYYGVIPHFSPLPGGGYIAWRFSALGHSISDVIKNTIINPGRMISIMFDTVEKQEKLKYFLYTGGLLLVFRQRYILLIIPTFFTTCLSDGWPLWGNMYYYNIIFAVLLPYVVISTIALFRSNIFKSILIGIAILLNLHYLDKNFFRDWRTFRRIFTYDYYHQRYNINEIREGLNLIPKDASVSASAYYTPHLAFRDKVYFFPFDKSAEYIAINEADGKERFFPFESSDKFFESVKEIRENQKYELIFQKKEMLVFKKKNRQ